jgi:transcriptional regulator with XRE-family HTH domain
MGVLRRRSALMTYSDQVNSADKHPSACAHSSYPQSYPQALKGLWAVDRLPDVIDAAANDQAEINLGASLRALRRAADLSQRELAARSGVPQASLARIESGETPNPGFRTVEALARASGSTLSFSASASAGAGGPGVGAGRPGTAIPHEGLRDQGGRHYPAHLDPIEVTRPEKWWGAWWTASVIRAKWPLEEVPPFTYDLSRSARDEQRERVARGALAVIRGDRRESAEDVRGGFWVWTARAEDEVVGELWAHEFDASADGMRWSFATAVPAGCGVLDGVAVLPEWQRLGIGRRLIVASQTAFSGGLISLASRSEGFLEMCGFARTHALTPPGWFFAAPPHQVR